MFACTRARSNMRTRALKKPFIVARDVTAEPGSTLAVEDHQFGQAFRVAHCHFVVGDGLLCFGDRRVLVAKYIGPKPPIEDSLVRFQYILFKAKASMKKQLIIFVCGVKIVGQIQ